MSSSLLAGVSGLRAHQELLDVVGNNLANINTPGFKSARATFSDLISETLNAGNGPTTGTGGTNPTQVGLGVRVASVDQDLRQGSLQTTGRTLDMGIEGEGFFVVNDGRQDLYTRVGTFNLDSQDNLVATGNGFRVQSVDGTDIKIDVNASLPAAATEAVTFTGNLDAAAKAPAAAVLGSLKPFHQGTRAAVTGASAEPFALVDGMQLSIKVDGQAAQTVTFRATSFAAIGAATAAEVASVMNAQLSGVNASVVGGSIVVQSQLAGAQSSIDIDDGALGPVPILGLSTTLVSGTEAPANAATPLNDLPEKTTPYVAGDRVNVTGIDSNGLPVSATFVYGSGAGQNGTTVGELVTFLGGLFGGSSVALAPDGTLSLTALATGDSTFQLVLADDPTNAGFTSFSNLPFVVTTPGSSGDTVKTAIEVVDSQGGKHTVDFLFHKTGANEWELTATLPGADGTIQDGQVQGILFNEDGSFNSVSGVGLGDGAMAITFDGLTASQPFTLDFGKSGLFGGLTQFGGSTTAAATDQDGFTSGSLSSLAINPDGVIQGIYTNGKVQELATIQIATFKNPAGLAKVGDSMLAVSANSGAALPGKAQSGRSGKLVSGVLENSNVDIALEFTRLITAQRGFQVNARTITTTDQMLQELANLVR